MITNATKTRSVMPTISSRSGGPRRPVPAPLSRQQRSAGPADTRRPDSPTAGAEAGGRRSKKLPLSGSATLLRLPQRRLQAYGPTTQRKPICVVEVSSACGDLAAGRYCRQYSGAHRCDPPFNALRIVGSAAGNGENQPRFFQMPRRCCDGIAETTVPVIMPSPLIIRSGSRGLASKAARRLAFARD
jgi:hypothetical protein